jgi:serine/threonine protein kinase
VLELLEGPGLDDYVQYRGPLPAEETARLGLLLADALRYIADAGVFRIDLKPSNVIMDEMRGPVIIDLGIAKSSQSTVVTEGGLLVGTPMYMAPEMFRGDAIDHRVDLYSLGLLLLFCLTGRAPREGQQLGEIIAKALHEPIDLSGLPVSPQFRQVLERTVAIDPADRYANAAQLHAALQEIPEVADRHDSTEAGFTRFDTAVLPELPFFLDGDD